MAEQFIPTKDRLHAQTLDRLSRVAVAVPFIGKIMGGGDHQRRWHFAEETPARSMHWHFFKGAKESGRVPSQYRHTALLGGLTAEIRNVRDAVIDRLPLAQRDTAVLAGAYRLGDAIMATEIELPFESDFANMVIGFGVGRGNLEANIGVYSPEGDTFHLLSESNLPAHDEVVKTLNPTPKYYDDLAVLYPYAHIQQL